MSGWRRFLVAGIGTLSLIGAGAAPASAEDRGGRLLEFDSMTPVTGAAVGAVNDRGIKGGGLPWAITAGRGHVDRNGHLAVTVEGLVIPVAPFNGTNPAANFRATVSCLTRDGVVNVTTGLFPATPSGNAKIEATVSLPRHCRQPILFVTSPTGAWFAMSNPEEDEDGD